jgi:uncharacterized protein (TIGR00730 family)
MAKLSICVFCGSRAGAKPSYEQAAVEMGKAIGANNWRLVYGAGDVGLMGTVARAAQAAGAETFGVIPEHLEKAEVGKSDLTEYVVTKNMHERKTRMYEEGDVIVVLPGGAGSLDEFFEVLTWRQLGLHEKPIYVVNTEGYWDKLLDLLDHVIDQGFASNSLKTLIKPVAAPAEIIEDLLG